MTSLSSAIILMLVGTWRRGPFAQLFRGSLRSWLYNLSRDVVLCMFFRIKRSPWPTPPQGFEVSRTAGQKGSSLVILFRVLKRRSDVGGRLEEAISLLGPANFTGIICGHLRSFATCWSS